MGEFTVHRVTGTRVEGLPLPARTPELTADGKQRVNERHTLELDPETSLVLESVAYKLFTTEAEGSGRQPVEGEMRVIADNGYGIRFFLNDGSRTGEYVALRPGGAIPSEISFVVMSFIAKDSEE